MFILMLLGVCMTRWRDHPVVKSYDVCVWVCVGFASQDEWATHWTALCVGVSEKQMQVLWGWFP